MSESFYADYQFNETEIALVQALARLDKLIPQIENVELREAIDAEISIIIDASSKL
jgi:hypothetical protein